MFHICVILSILLTWCNCDYSAEKYDQQPDAARLHHFGHYGRIIASPTGVTNLEEATLDPEIEDRHSQFIEHKPKIRRRFHQQISYYPTRRWDFQDYQYQRRGYEDYGLFAGHHGGMDRSDFYYVLPILLVIGLGAFLIPIITTFFTALVTSNTALCGRRKRNDHLVGWKPRLQEKVLEMWTTVEKAFQTGFQKYGNIGANNDQNDDSSKNTNTTNYRNNGHFHNR
uniref:Uncharacterized protein n=1 Tax=Tetranychus urticae TaxID=32264 RepID=T1KRR9_TETUR